MTSEQKLWLDSHPEYRPLGRVGGFSRFIKRGTLLPNGTFELATKAKPVRDGNGAFGVGVFVQNGGPSGTPNLNG
jgi:hypothetical protein